jgi:hypothetical protein
MKTNTQVRAFALIILAAFVGTIASATLHNPAIGFLVATASVVPFTSLASRKLAAHLELLSFSATQPNTGAAAAALAGDSLVVKGTGGTPKIAAWWADHQVAGFQRLIFPSGHDTTSGIKVPVRASEVDQLLPEGMGIVVQPQETLSIQIGGSNTSGDVESGSMLMLYPNMVGSAQRGISWANLLKDTEKLVTVYMTLTGAAAGYTGSATIASVTDLLIANRNYAVLGGTISAESATIALVGPDTGNVKIGFPANDLEPEVGMNFFPRMARAFNLSIIPVINSANKSNTLLSFVQDENNITPTVGLYLALLRE